MTNRVRPNIAALALAGLAMLLLLAAPGALAANGKAVLRPDPVSLGMKSGEQGTISILVDKADSLYGIEFHLQFDPAILQVVDMDAAKPDVQLKPGAFLPNAFVAVNKADNTTGKIDYAATLLNPAQPVNGTGVIATITFKAKKDGTSPLKIDKAILATREAKEISSEWQNGAIGVSAAGQAPQVQVTTGGSATAPTGGSAANPASQPANTFMGLPLPQVALLGVTGLGILGFVFAAVLVLGIVLWKRR